MKLNILWNNKYGSDIAKKNKHLLAKGFSLEVATETKEAKQYLPNIDVLVSGNPDEILLDSPNLKHVIVPFVGINPNLRKNILARPHLKLYNSHFNDAFVAQHTLALLLALSNRIIKANQTLKQGNWLWGEENKTLSLQNKSCLLLGYGAIGKQIEKTMRALGMNISIVKRDFKEIDNAIVYPKEDLNTALQNADVIMLSLPLTTETENLIDEKAFAAMKKEAIIINVGRGKLIDQFALYRALKNKQIFGAGIDVWWNYPKEGQRENTLPSEAKLHKLDNIIMSSHRANNVANWEYTAFKDVLQTLKEISQGKERNLVNVNRGY